MHFPILSNSPTSCARPFGGAVLGLLVAVVVSMTACDKSAAGTENPDGGGAAVPSGDGSSQGGDGGGAGEGGGSDAAASSARGKELFQGKCGECHDLPAPADHSASEWPTIMADMGPKADLSEGDTKLVLDYILSVRGA